MAIARQTPPLGLSEEREGSDRLVLTRRRIFILPTLHGLSFALAVLVMLIGSLNYGNSLGFGLSFILASMGLISILHTYHNLHGLHLRSGPVQPVFAGETARYPLCLESREHQPRHALSLEHPPVDGKGEKKGRYPIALTVELPDAGVCWTELPLRALRRGRLEAGKVRVTTRFPLGLFRAWSWFRPRSSCLVYPRPEGRLPLPEVGALTGRPEGRVGRGQEDFFGFREHVRGDSPKLVHWKAAAREQGMLHKLFTGEDAGELMLSWEQAGDGGRETRLSQLCRWVLEAHKGGRRYGLSIPGVELPPDQGEQQLCRCLEALALFPGWEEP